MDVRLIASAGYNLWADPDPDDVDEAVLCLRPSLSTQQGGELHVRIVIPD